MKVPEPALGAVQATQRQAFGIHSISAWVGHRALSEGVVSVSSEFETGPLTRSTTHADVLARPREARTDVGAIDPVALSDDQRLEALRSVLAGANQLNAAAARVCPAVDSSAQWAADGARSSSAWIGRRTNTDS